MIVLVPLVKILILEQMFPGMVQLFKYGNIWTNRNRKTLIFIKRMIFVVLHKISVPFTKT